MQCLLIISRNRDGEPVVPFFALFACIFATVLHHPVCFKHFGEFNSEYQDENIKVPFRLGFRGLLPHAFGHLLQLSFAMFFNVAAIGRGVSLFRDWRSAAAAAKAKFILDEYVKDGAPRSRLASDQIAAGHQEERRVWSEIPLKPSRVALTLRFCVCRRHFIDCVHASNEAKR